MPKKLTVKPRNKSFSQNQHNVWVTAISTEWPPLLLDDASWSLDFDWHERNKCSSKAEEQQKWNNPAFAPYNHHHLSTLFNLHGLDPDHSFFLQQSPKVKANAYTVPNTVAIPTITNKLLFLAIFFILPLNNFLIISWGSQPQTECVFPCQLWLI